MKHLVFLHGFLENSTMWQPVLDRISKSTFKIHFPEIPGHGKNLAIPENHDVANYADNFILELEKILKKKKKTEKEQLKRLEKTENVIFE